MDSSAILTALELDRLQLAVLIAVMIVAAVARGYAGFGSSAIVITSASLVVPPATLVPVLYILEVCASIHMFPSIRREVEYPLFWPMLAGTMVGIPAGQYLLTHMPADTVRIALSLWVLGCAVAIWRGVRFGRSMSTAFAVVTGLATGLGSGLAVVGGLIMVVMLLGTDYPAARTRAMCIVIFLGMYSYGTAVSYLNGLISASTLWLVLVLSIPLIAGLVIGQRRYLVTSPERFRQFVLVFLMTLALVGIVRALVL